jgi:hypothetical protein
VLICNGAEKSDDGPSIMGEIMENDGNIWERPVVETSLGEKLEETVELAHGLGTRAT